MEKKKYSLIVDIGNSQISAGIFDDLNLLYRFDVDSDGDSAYTFGITFIDFINKNNLKKEDFDSGFICSVVPRLTRWVQIVINQILGVNCLLMSKEMQKEIKVDKEITEELGGDLVADIVAAVKYYGTPCIITDLGTVTKTLVVDKDGVFIGARFYPGLKASLQSMGDKAALIPSFDSIKFDKENPPEFKFGKNTVDCMRAGIYWGTISSILYMNKSLCEELGKNTKHIISGGYSNVISKGLTDEGLLLDPDLVLKGLAIIFKNNRK